MAVFTPGSETNLSASSTSKARSPQRKSRDSKRFQDIPRSKQLMLETHEFFKTKIVKILLWFSVFQKKTVSNIGLISEVDTCHFGFNFGILPESSVESRHNLGQTRYSRFGNHVGRTSECFSSWSWLRNGTWQQIPAIRGQFIKCSELYLRRIWGKGRKVLGRVLRTAIEQLFESNMKNC